MFIHKTTMTLPSFSLLTREDPLDALDLSDHPLWAMVIFLSFCFFVMGLMFASTWFVERSARARQRGLQLSAQVRVPEARDDQRHAPDTRSSRSAQPPRGSGGRETRHGRRTRQATANIRTGTTEPLETHTRHVRGGAPSPPPAYNSLEPVSQPTPRTALLAAAPVVLYGVPAALLDSSNPPCVLLPVNFQQGDEIGRLNTSSQHYEHGSTPRRDGLFYLAATFTPPQRSHGR
ncbi:hypothetical protein GALMADRAFT_136379 [Galerina marginata CBS 339.88]|uniref:Uncharacterized protein n=1 Tax=Galerina marginata (strain CBS 339.88) TaxID=685588 RepID=A0A067T980_GALM3|nr:hypothetical protein GALMADRAFT_136379 [Galerina marginata CBS 339.88]